MAAGAVALAMAVPVGYLALRALEGSDPVGQVLTARAARLVWNTTRLALCVTVLAVVLGVGTAWLLERSDLPARRALGVVAVLPLVVPTYVGALALVAAFGPRGIAWEVPGLVSFWGLAAALTLATYPYVLLTARGVLRSTDPALEDSARSLGDGPWACFRRVTLPQLRPAISAGGLLVCLYVLSDFGAVAIMRFDTLTRAIFLEYRGSFDRARPAVLGVVLVVLTVAVIAGEHRLRGRAAPARATAGVRPAPVVELGPWRGVATVAVIGVCLAGVGVPVAVLAYWASTGPSGEAGSVVVRAAANSVQLSSAAAVVAAVAALPVAVLAVRHRSRFSSAVESLAASGYALPGLVIALSLVFLTSRVTPTLYQTFVVVVAAYVVRFLPEALGSVRSSLHQVDPALEDVARSLGRTRLGAARTVTLPLVWAGVVAGAALVFLTAMKELPATLLLQPAGQDTLATRVWAGASQGLYAQAAPAALVLVALSAALLWPLQQRRRHRRQPLDPAEVPAG
ncbi:MAG TPA: iron ABC transporter permease [Chloroflexota bacterium]|nr:iron ABC transporter permease [Chloroflexota bacterium]